MLKVAFHAHSGDDPIDRIWHSTWQLIDRAADLGYNALAVTLHERQLDPGPFRFYAKARGITLIPGIEKTIEGKHVLLLNFRRGAEEVDTFADLQWLKRRERGLVIAPHPFFPGRCCLHGKLSAHADLFDAVEWNAMFTARVNFNAKAERWARAHGKPMVGNGDVHRLRQLGTTYSLVDAEPHADAICEAIREGKVGVFANPLRMIDAGVVMTDLMTSPVTRFFRVPPVLDRPTASADTL